MAAKRKRRPKRLQWRMECLAHTVGELLAAMLPGHWVFRMGEWLGGLAWYLFPARRRIVLRNLRIAYAAEKDLGEIHRMARETFRRTGANLVSAAHTARLSPEQLCKVFRLENPHLMEEARAEGKGVVVLLAHMGNWEVLCRLVHLFPPGTHIGGFYRPLNNPYLNERVLDRRQKDGTRMFSKRDPFHQITGFLRDGGIVGVLADQRIGNQGDIIRFFGRATRASPLPCLLARRSKSTVLALSLVTEGPGKWKAVLSRVPSPGTTAGCMAALESFMKTSPLDVFWLQERWKVRVRAKVPPSQWLGTAVPAEGEKPLRALLWLPGIVDPRAIPDTWRPPAVTYEAALAPGQPLPDWLDPSTAVHTFLPPAGDREMIHLIERIDASAILPLDFILTPVKCEPLIRAGHHLELAVVTLL